MTVNNMTEQEERNFYEEVLQKDGQAIEAYIEEVYSRSAPPPEPPNGDELSFWKIAGLESSLFVLSGVGAAILSAIRTGGLFYILEVLLIEKFGLNSTLGAGFGFVSMISALFAFEGFLLAYGLRKGKESGKINVSRTGLGISLVTVISAGVFSSFSIVNVTTGWQLLMNILLAIITGGASALIAFYASENLGFILNHVTSKKNEILSTHQKDYTRWREGAVGAYLNSAYNIRLKRSNKIYGGSNSTDSNNTSEPNHNQDKNSGSTDWRVIGKHFKKDEKDYILSLETKEDILEYANQRGVNPKTIENWKRYILQERGLIGTEDNISEFIQSNNRFPNEQELTGMGISAKVLVKYIAENQDEIRQRNLLGEDIIQKAVERFNE
jgi:hypothetical protein